MLCAVTCKYYQNNEENKKKCRKNEIMFTASMVFHYNKYEWNNFFVGSNGYSNELFRVLFFILLNRKFFFFLKKKNKKISKLHVMENVKHEIEIIR